MTVRSVSAKNRFTVAVASPRCMARTWQQQIRIQHDIAFPTNTNTCLSGNVEFCRSTSKIFFITNCYLFLICFLYFKVSQVHDTLSLTCKQLSDMHVHMRKQGRRSVTNSRPTASFICCSMVKFGVRSRGWGGVKAGAGCVIYHS